MKAFVCVIFIGGLITSGRFLGLGGSASHESMGERVSAYLFRIALWGRIGGVSSLRLRFWKAWIRGLVR